MDMQHMTRPESARNSEISAPPSSEYVTAYVRDRFAIKAADTAKTIARLAGLGEEGARQ